VVTYSHQCREDNDDCVKSLHLANVQNFRNSSADQDAVKACDVDAADADSSASSRFATQSLTYIQCSVASVGITIALNLIAIVTVRFS